MACATYLPQEEMVLAEVALEAAREAKAEVHEPFFFQKAEFYFKSAKTAYQNREYDFAKQFALKSKEFSEKAEEGAMVKEVQSQEK